MKKRMNNLNIVVNEVEVIGFKLQKNQITSQRFVCNYVPVFSVCVYVNFNFTNTWSITLWPRKKKYTWLLSHPYESKTIEFIYFSDADSRIYSIICGYGKQLFLEFSLFTSTKASLYPIKTKQEFVVLISFSYGLRKSPLILCSKSM